MNLKQLFCSHDYVITKLSLRYIVMTCSKCGKEKKEEV